MIRILAILPLSPETTDTLSEIPEFEINAKTGLSSRQLLEEIRNVDVLVTGGAPFVSAEILAAAVDLKLIIAGQGSGQVDEAAARRRHIEIRGITASGGGKGGPAGDSQAISILKDFFNV